jgi:hypothetical protein
MPATELSPLAMHTKASSKVVLGNLAIIRIDISIHQFNRGLPVITRTLICKRVKNYEIVIELLPHLIRV